MKIIDATRNKFILRKKNGNTSYMQEECMLAGDIVEGI